MERTDNLMQALIDHGFAYQRADALVSRVSYHLLFGGEKGEVVAPRDVQVQHLERLTMSQLVDRPTTPLPDIQVLWGFIDAAGLTVAPGAKVKDHRPASGARRRAQRPAEGGPWQSTTRPREAPVTPLRRGNMRPSTGGPWRLG